MTPMEALNHLYDGVDRLLESSRNLCCANASNMTERSNELLNLCREVQATLMRDTRIIESALEKKS